MDIKKINKFFKYFFYICFLCFLTFYVAGESGYYEYNERKKMSFTKEQIEKFENDVKNGKNIDITAYIENADRNYQNRISKTTLEISEGISKYTKKGIELIFTKLGNMIEET